MKQIITAKLKLLTRPEQYSLLRQIQLAYRDALNYVSRYAFEQGKTSNNERLQKGSYHEIRLLYGLPSQMACNVPQQVAGTYKGMWTKLMQNREYRRAGRTKKRYRGQDQPSKYVPPTLTYNYGYDYGGVRMRAPPARERSTDLDGPRVNDLPIEWGGLQEPVSCKPIDQTQFLSDRCRASLRQGSHRENSDASERFRSYWRVLPQLATLQLLI